MTLVLLLLATNPHWVAGQKQFAALEFEAAARSLSIAVQQPDLSVDERRAAYHLWAQALIAVRRPDEAETVLARLLRDDPHAPAPKGAAPKIQEAFARARQRSWPRPSVSFKPAPWAEGPSVKVELIDPWSLVARVRQVDVLPAGPAERESVTVRDHALSVRPGEGAQRVVLDALAENDRPLAHLDLEVPQPPSVSVSARADEPVARSPVVAVVSGVAAVLAGAGGGALLGLGYRAPPPLETAGAVNGWNAQVRSQAGFGFGLVVAGTVAAIIALIDALR